MQRIIDTSAAVALPAPPALTGTTGYFTEGSPGVVAATKLRGWWANMIQEELIAVLVAAGITPDTTATNFAQLLAAIRIVPHGRLIGTQVFTANGTYTPTAGMGTVIFEVQGGGGSGSGSGSAAGGNVSVGTPGTAGSYVQALFTAAQVGVSQPILIGLGGASASGSPGANGGTSGVGTAGALISVPGGIAGGHTPNQVPPFLAGNGNASGAPVVTGGTTIVAIQGSASALTLALGGSMGGGGAGGQSQFGAGGFGTTINNPGTNAFNPGAGGAGCVCNSGPGNIIGGAGFRGLVIAREFS